MIASRGSSRYAYAVGYFNKELADSFQAVAPSFVSIGVDGFNLSELKVEGVPTSKNDYYVEIQMLNDSGVAEVYYEWYHGASAPRKTDGWYENDDTLVDGDDYEVTFDKGQGLWVTAIEGAKFISSGEVLNENLTLDLEEGFTMIANPFPTTIGLSTVTVSDVEASKNDYFIEIQMLNDSGVPEVYYEWYHGASAPRKTDGWYENDDTLVDGDDYEVDLLPGQALWLNVMTEGAKLTFNCPYDLSAK